MKTTMAIGVGCLALGSIAGCLPPVLRVDVTEPDAAPVEDGASAAPDVAPVVVADVPPAIPDDASPGVPDDASAVECLPTLWVRWDPRWTVTLTIGGASQTASTSPTGTVVFRSASGAPIDIDLAALCARTDVVCPDEIFPSRVWFWEGAAPVASFRYLYLTFGGEPSFPGCARAVGAIDPSARLTFAQAGVVAGGSCGALALNATGGRVVRGPSSTITGIADGRFRIGILGVCAANPLLLGASIEIEAQYTAEAAPCAPLPAVCR